MLIMSIIHAPKIESVTMRVDGDGLLETSKTSSRPSRIVTGNICVVKAVLLRYTFVRLVIAYGFALKIRVDTDYPQKIYLSDTAKISEKLLSNNHRLR